MSIKLVPEGSHPTIDEYFDITNLDHLRAFQHLLETGVWPRDFWDAAAKANVRYRPLWEYVIKSKLAAAYLQEKLG